MSSVPTSFSMPHPSSVLWTALTPLNPTKHSSGALFPVPSMISNAPPNAVIAQVKASLCAAVAAGAGVLPGYRAMLRKTAAQTEQPIPIISWVEAVKKGTKGAPVIGAMVAIQTTVQPGLERKLAERSQNKDSLYHMFVSSTIVGTAFAPFLAVFNGQTMGWSAKESLTRFSRWQLMALIGREILTVSALAAAGKITGKKEGQVSPFDYVKIFFTGAVSSIGSHPLDSIFTRTQCGLKVTSVRQLWFGALPKAWAAGCFFVVYEGGKQILGYRAGQP